MTKDMCEVTYIHEDKVNRAKKNLAKQNPMDVAKVFKALPDDTRVRTAYVLSSEGELCVCDVANIIESSTAMASHRLGLLKDLDITKYRKEGGVVYCSLDDEHVKQLIEKFFLYQREVASIGQFSKNISRR